MADGSEELIRDRGFFDFNRHKEELERDPYVDDDEEDDSSDAEDDEETPKDLKKELKRHKRLSKLGKVTALSAGAYALHQRRRAKKDPENAAKYRRNQEIAVAAGLGAAGFAFHERHKKQDLKDEINDE